MSMIQVVNLTFAYEGSYDNIFEDVNFQLDTNWKLGFTGRNGRGKTTFLNLLMGRYEYKGRICAAVEFEYFPYEVKDIDKETLEIVYEINPFCELWQLEKELSKLQVDEEVLYRQFSTLSYGERAKVLLAVLFLKDNAFLLIDEPTSHLDKESRKIVADYLNSKKGFILVSHDRAFLDSCIDHILAINKADIQVEKGNFSSWYENKKRQDEFELKENSKLKKEIKRLTESCRQAGQWADQVESTKIGRKSRVYEQCIDTRAYIGEKSRRMQMRRKNLQNRQEKAIEDKKKLLKNLETGEDLKLFPEKHYASCLLEFRNVNIQYKETGKNVCTDLNMFLCEGDRIVLTGKNGCGKSSLLKAVLQAAGFGDKSRQEVNSMDIQGEWRAASGMRISYVPQSAEFLRGSLYEFISQNKLDETLFLTVLRKLNFSRDQFQKNMEEFSEGQKKKVLLAASLCEKAHLYIWDEPLNYIDVFSRIQLENLIEKYKPTMIFVEHDQIFAQKISTKELHL
ncbi:MAG: ABC-F type ribosomal protection protein [Lachnoclostridium edouardi]|uniref:ribosomal protection-like ABC-F family protein n=1 Tax=Lachnoclostridium edouardi TaxID=1926283 RepID=UPI0026DB9DAC|nr:ABC-F type ribosomal protection protein [Lachnoclostridium edouardi]MDO4278839.1 ABC-F type ribosomal protection protein [Lachnoclostridium edouardi]